MSIYIDTTALQKITRLALAFRKDGKCCTDVTSDAIRIRSRSEDYEAYLDYSLPTSIPELTIHDVTDSYWLRYIHTNKILGTAPGPELTLRPPAETPDSTITFHSGSFTYRQAPMVEQNAHKIFDEIETESLVELSLQNGVLDCAIQVADLLGDELRIRFNPETSDIEFSTDGDTDSFEYRYPVEEVHSAQASPTELTISIDRFRDVTPLIPSTDVITLVLAPRHLRYGAEYPVAGADLTVYIATRLGVVES